MAWGEARLEPGLLAETGLGRRSLDGRPGILEGFSRPRNTKTDLCEWPALCNCPMGVSRRLVLPGSDDSFGIIPGKEINHWQNEPVAGLYQYKNILMNDHWRYGWLEIINSKITLDK